MPRPIATIALFLTLATPAYAQPPGEPPQPAVAAPPVVESSAEPKASEPASGDGPAGAQAEPARESAAQETPATNEGAPAGQGSRPPEPAKKKKELSLAIFEFAANEKSVEEKAQALGVLVATRLAQSSDVRVVGVDQVRAALGLEKQKALLGCTDSSCMAEISGALGVRYILQGRLDRFGKKYVVTGVVLDARNAQSLARMREDVYTDEDLPNAADSIGDRAAAAIGVRNDAAGTVVAEPGDESGPYPSDFHFNFKLGNMLPALQDFSRLALRLDIEGDYYIKPFLTAFVEAGLVIGRSEATAQRSGGTFSLVPVSAGLKYVFRSDQHVRPYAGLGLGLGILAALVDAPSNDRIGLKFNGLAGVAWLPWRRVGFNAEVSADLAGLTVNQGSNLFFGFNTNFGVLVLF